MFSLISKPDTSQNGWLFKSTFSSLKCAKWEGNNFFLSDFELLFFLFSLIDFGLWLQGKVKIEICWQTKLTQIYFKGSNQFLLINCSLSLSLSLPPPSSFAEPLTFSHCVRITQEAKSRLITIHLPTHNQILFKIYQDIFSPLPTINNFFVDHFQVKNERATR